MALEGESLCFGLYAYKPIEITETRIDFERRYFDFWDCELAKRLWHLIWFSPRHFRTPLVAEKLWFSPVFSEKININLPFIWIRWAEFLCCKKCIVIYCMIITKYFSSFVFRSSFLLLVYNGKHFHCLNYDNCLWVNKGLRQKVILCCKVKKQTRYYNISSSLYCCRGNVDDWHSYCVNNILCILSFNTFKLFTSTIRIR